MSASKPNTCPSCRLPTRADGLCAYCVTAEVRALGAARRGRPRGDRTCKMHTRHTPTEREAWELAARVEDLPLSAWVRRVLNREAARLLASIEEGK